MDQQPRKLCFVTVGATASFFLLLRAILDPEFLKALHLQSYTDLLIQYGKDGQHVFDEFEERYPQGDPSRHGVTVVGFDFNQAGLDVEMRLAKAKPSENRSSGLVISHAGSGSILSTLRFGIPLVVVPNPTLQDNHQEELAEVLQNEGYALWSSYKDLPLALERAETLRDKMLNWPPVQGVRERAPQNLEGVVSEEMGYLD
ncbi:N-acetylglucosaminyldiphosphodolichol N-acetylglucosaminyltransferase catalytic subunit ALG13 [Aspergillus stella-maris]|uniref:N-acetylglucosaminyldiphosphodolichol N-acetylglucosaminyltransferase catalytic subunit ALG13 n=1 Tax=Aspergillus stella-maris TaxID=1810926 RepID=UPI003CCE17ED